MRNPTISRREPPVKPRGEACSLWRATLEAGAALLKDFDVYVAGLAKDANLIGIEYIVSEQFSGTAPIPGVVDAGS